RRGRRMLRDVPRQVRHVFCATEVHTSHHAYFSHDLFYVPGLGIADSGSLRLSTAVQSSANFQRGFPFRFIVRRLLKMSGIAFNRQPQNDRPIFAELITLTDGGVYDNTGASWFVEAENRPDGHLRDWYKGLKQLPKDERRAVLRLLVSMKKQP